MEEEVNNINNTWEMRMLSIVRNRLVKERKGMDLS